MIKSINYRANQIASIEISDASDVQSLGDSYGYGSTARVTGQIGDEYIYTPQGWIKISSGGTEVVANPELEGDEDSLTGLQVGDTKYKVGGSSGGGVLVVHGTLSISDGTITLDKTWTEIASAEFAVISVASDGLHLFLHINSIIHDGTAYGVGACGDPSNSKELTFFEFLTDSPDGYPAANIN